MLAGSDPGRRDEGKLLYSPYVVEGYRSLKNSSAPHLHFHVMTSPSVPGSEGVPYEFDSFELAGPGTDAQFDATLSTGKRHFPSRDESRFASQDGRLQAQKRSKDRR